MYKCVEVVIDKDELNREIYRFTLMEFKLLLDSYGFETRETKRHKFKRVKWYDRLNQRDSTIKKENMFLPENIKQIAFEKMMQLYKENMIVTL